MIQKLKNLVKNQAFYPTPIFGRILNPFYFARCSLNEAVKKNATHFNGKILDVGCGSKPYRDYFPSHDYIGMDVSTPDERPEIRADVFYDGKVFPFSPQSFDHVVSFQVLEHVKDPDFFISEISRVIKNDGTVLLTVPFIWEEHEAPHDRTRYTSYGLKELFDKHALRVMSHEKLSVGFIGIVQLFTGTVVVGIAHYPKAIRYGVQFLFIAPIHFLASIFKFIIPKNDRLFLDNLVVAKKK